MYHISSKTVAVGRRFTMTRRKGFINENEKLRNALKLIATSCNIRFFCLRIQQMHVEPHINVGRLDRLHRWGDRHRYIPYIEKDVVLPCEQLSQHELSYRCWVQADATAPTAFLSPAKHQIFQLKNYFHSSVRSELMKVLSTDDNQQLRITPPSTEMSHI